VITEGRLELSHRGRALVVADEATTVGLNVRVTARPVTDIVVGWWILARNWNMGVLVYLVATNLHMVLLMVG